MTLFDSSFERWVVKNTGRSLELASAIQAGQGSVPSAVCES